MENTFTFNSSERCNFKHKTVTALIQCTEQMTAMNKEMITIIEQRSSEFRKFEKEHPVRFFFFGSRDTTISNDDLFLMRCRLKSITDDQQKLNNLWEALKNEPEQFTVTQETLDLIRSYTKVL